MQRSSADGHLTERETLEERVEKRKFSEAALKEVESTTSSYPVTDSAILPLLHIAQREFGCVDEEAVRLIARTLDVEPLRVKETMSFYTMFDEKPRGKYLIEVCTNISCSLLGSDSLLGYLEERLKVPRGSTTPDGLVTLITVECLGSCGTAPVMSVNGEYHEGVTREKLDDLLREIGV
ncbi:MAG: NAD(P)H-dependent oxidoreductase subunit E [Candidatus Eiseniibacteriota bacterium]|nr:MAG: NAD(P)H-dependent oxidoreductase subunit E [Candidatus Eisenbacteria bacterium]